MQSIQKLGKSQRKKLKSFITRVLFSKRQRFIFAVIVLSLGLFASEYILGKSAISIVFFLSLLTVVFLYFTLRQDLKGNFNIQVFILPFFYSLAVGTFLSFGPGQVDYPSRYD